MTILLLSILFKWIGYDRMEKALYRTKLLINKEEKENIEEKLHIQAECLCRKPLKKIKTNEKKLI